jgi:hypothetical protein
MSPMLILDKARALDRLIVCSARAHVPEQFALRALRPLPPPAIEPEPAAPPSILDWWAARRPAPATMRLAS